MVFLVCKWRRSSHLFLFDYNVKIHTSFNINLIIPQLSKTFSYFNWIIILLKFLILSLKQYLKDVFNLLSSLIHLIVNQKEKFIK